MNCKELVYLLGEYLDGTMEDHLRKDLDVHISMCDSCLNFLTTFDKTRIICRQVRLDEIPEEFRIRLKSFVMQKAAERHAGIDKYIRMAEEERHRDVLALIGAYRTRTLSPALSVLFESHRDRCGKCGAFLRSINGGEERISVPEEIEEHLAEFLDAIPPGEVPFRQ